jgi:calcineurin-like phosphoesterase family protein
MQRTASPTSWHNTSDSTLADRDTRQPPSVTTDPYPPRVIDIDAGVAMVVTDLHGNLPLYERYRDIYLELHRQGLAQTLVFAGDLIHSEGTGIADGSLEIILDLIDLKARLGSRLVVLLGNHEMPHIYHVPLSKGKVIYTPQFEAVMGQHREVVLDFFRRRPFFARTAAGVAICHAGAFPEAGDPSAMDRLRTFSHRRILQEVEAELADTHRPALRAAIEKATQSPYLELSRLYCGVTGPEDPRYDDYLISVLAGFRDDFKLLWSALFSQNEYAGEMSAYAAQVRDLLLDLSRDYRPQRTLVTGHIGCRNGYRIVAEGLHLRVASGAHAHPYTSAKYLLFDAGQAIGETEDLLPGLGSVFGE